MELGSFDDFMNVTDDYGNTILHTATALKQIETMKYLLNTTAVRVNAVNGNGFTAVDIIEHTPKDLKAMEIRELLVEARALRARIIPASPRDYPQVSSECNWNEMSRPVPEHREVAAAPSLTVTHRVAMSRTPSRSNNIIISDHLKKK
ncbi:ankyrin repeat-containing protein At2g01680-like [Cornus florida]|uniref:ankyrin repeat-containing protein At2g01680-like n=1 Tax=Cornus florida TaxID=4283 RepID=UPI002897CD1F|nr:ankyrin repeat-containing protein At2g01680-like [Cornus florida]